MSEQFEVEQLIAEECKSKRAVILEEGASHEILEPGETKKLRPYKFSQYLQDTGLQLFYPIVLYYYGMKKGFSEFSYSAYQLLNTSNNTVKQLGLTEHLSRWEGKAEPWPAEEELIDLFGKALVEEIRARGIFDKIDKMFQTNIES